MKKKYVMPHVEVIHAAMISSILENSGTLPPGVIMSKENDLTWNDEVNDLWGDEPEEGK